MAAADDEVLADAWSAELARPITHEEHIRMAVVLLRRHGREEGIRRIDDGTRRLTAALGAEERYDAVLTRRWSEALADALAETGAQDADELLCSRPELLRSDLFGPPAWKVSSGL